VRVKVLIRGGGDLASGVALRLFRSGFWVIITELDEPLTVRRSVSFSEAVYRNEVSIEGVQARLVNDYQEAGLIIHQGMIPVIIDQDAAIKNEYNPDVIIDSRMLKAPSELYISGHSPFIIGVGPGFQVGKDCHAVIETKRGHYLGRVLWEGSAERDSGLPEAIHDQRSERVLRSPGNGIFHSDLSIGDQILEGQNIFSVGNILVYSPFSGIVRGLIHDGITVNKGLKVGDIDPRNDKNLIHFVSDKALAVGGAVLEAILSQGDLRTKLANSQ
jgi:xanthine dehydrogenase accessory factor